MRIYVLRRYLRTTVLVTEHYTLMDALDLAARGRKIGKRFSLFSTTVR